MSTTLERDLRDALARQAASFHPRPREVPAPAPGSRLARRVLLPVAAVVVPVALLVAAVLAFGAADDGDREQIPAAPVDDLAHLVVDGAALGLVEEGTVEIGAHPGNVDQAFRVPGEYEAPMAFVTTVTDLRTFGLIDPAVPGAEVVTVRGADGVVLPNDAAAQAILSVELDDGRALFVIASRFTVEELIAFVDGLQPRDDGLWDPPPGDLEEVVTPALDGAHWEVEGQARDARFVVSLRPDGFDSMLSDRIASTVAPVEQVAVAGVPAALGSYNEVDWWVLLEPRPGRTVELRISGDRAAVEEVLAAAHFVDEATWRELFP